MLFVTAADDLASVRKLTRVYAASADDRNTGDRSKNVSLAVAFGLMETLLTASKVRWTQAYF